MGSSRHWMRRLFAPSHGGSSREGLGLALLLTVAIVAGGGALAGGAPEAGAQGYSPYSDPEKPALSHVLSDQRNVAEFQEQFGLGDGEMEAVLSAVREENEGLSRAQGESRRVIEPSGGLSDEQVRGRIQASKYDEKVEEAVARTKTTVERVLPSDRRPELKTWVDNKWQQERQKAQERGAANRAAASATGTRYFEVFATQYEGYTNYEVALPHKGLKFDGGYKVSLSLGDRAASAPVKEVGPWNLKDNWWDKSRYRTKWNDLPRGLPEAEAAFYDNYNKGKDGFGRKVLNPAGVDLTPAVAKKLGLRKYENAWIWVSYPLR